MFVTIVALVATAVAWVTRRALHSARRRRLSLPRRRDLAELGPRALTRPARRLRPSLTRPAAGDVGVRLGAATATGTEVWASAEDTLVLYGPPRSGKTMHVVIPAVVDWPGPAVVTDEHGGVHRCDPGGGQGGGGGHEGEQDGLESLGGVDPGNPEDHEAHASSKAATQVSSRACHTFSASMRRL